MKVSFWLKSKAEGVQELPKMPEECLSEIKNSGLRKIHCMLTEIDKLGVNNIINCKDFSINCKDFSSLHHLSSSHSTSQLKFCRILLAKFCKESETASEYDHVKTFGNLVVAGVYDRYSDSEEFASQLRFVYLLFDDCDSFGLFQGEN